MEQHHSRVEGSSAAHTNIPNTSSNARSSLAAAYTNDRPSPRETGSVLPIRVAPGQSLSPEDYHYVVNVRYPLLGQPLGAERAAALLLRARDAAPRMVLAWARLSQPHRMHTL